MDMKGIVPGAFEWVPMASGVLPQEHSHVWITDTDGALFSGEFFADCLGGEPQFYMSDGQWDSCVLVPRNTVMAWGYQFVPEPYRKE